MKSQTMKYKLILSALLIFVFLCCQQQSSEVKPGTVKINILYPHADGKTFDMDYYRNSHMPMVAELFGEPLIRYDIETGISGRTPEDPLPYLAIGTFYFDTLEAYNQAFAPHAEQILGDIPNYTDIQPVVQISEVVR